MSRLVRLASLVVAFAALTACAPDGLRSNSTVVDLAWDKGGRLYLLDETFDGSRSLMTVTNGRAAGSFPISGGCGGGAGSTVNIRTLPNGSIGLLETCGDRIAVNEVDSQGVATTLVESASPAGKLPAYMDMAVDRGRYFVSPVGRCSAVVELLDKRPAVEDALGSGGETCSHAVRNISAQSSSFYYFQRVNGNEWNLIRSAGDGGESVHLVDGVRDPNDLEISPQGSVFFAGKVGGVEGIWRCDAAGQVKKLRSGHLYQIAINYSGDRLAVVKADSLDVEIISVR